MKNSASVLLCQVEWEYKHMATIYESMRHKQIANSNN